MAILRSFPLFAVLLVIYNILMFTGDINATLAAQLFSIGLMSGAVWVMTVADLLILLGVVTLYIEIFKATRTNMASVIDHTLSTLVFVAFILEFVLVKGAGTSTFMILGLMAILDVVAGFTVTIVAARRDFGFNPGSD